jgi:hypothetical protein
MSFSWAEGDIAQRFWQNTWKAYPIEDKCFQRIPFWQERKRKDLPMENNERERLKNQAQEESKSALEVIIPEDARLSTGCISVPAIRLNLLLLQ